MKKFSIIIACILILSIICNLTSCKTVDGKRLDLYLNDDNYKEKTAIIQDICNYTNYEGIRYTMISIEVPSRGYISDNGNLIYKDGVQMLHLTLFGKSRRTVRKNDFENLVNIGDEATITFTSYLLGGNITHPIVALSSGDTVFLDFEEGKSNWLEWLKE